MSFQNGEKLFLHTKIATAILYDGYIHSWFMEISSTKTSELFKRIGNDKQKHCESHYWCRAIGWLNEDEILVNGFSDGDGGAGDRWTSSKEKVNYSIIQIYSFKL
ncbi:MAG: hypothetical protein KBF93_02635 [Leptospiraceae bacterium]|nr:hypothetical protein [Leptospiraceae bacterium]